MFVLPDDYSLVLFGPLAVSPPSTEVHVMLAANEN